MTDHALHIRNTGEHCMYVKVGHQLDNNDFTDTVMDAGEAVTVELPSLIHYLRITFGTDPAATKVVYCTDGTYVDLPEEYQTNTPFTSTRTIAYEGSSAGGPVYPKIYEPKMGELIQNPFDNTSVVPYDPVVCYAAIGQGYTLGGQGYTLSRTRYVRYIQ
jgi:hypothetical protein